MAKLTLTDISSTYGSIAVQNANNQRIEDAIENTLSRDGSTPNQMLAQLDMNTNRIINLAAPVNANDAVRYIDAQTLNLPEQAGHSGQYLRSNGTLSDWAVPPASEISNTPAGTIVATDVQAALNELDTEKLALAGGTMTGTLVFTDLSDGTIIASGWVDEDNMISNSATLIPTQQSVKAYVDAHTSLTAAHGTSGSVVGTSDTQTLTNKTINLTSNTLTGTLAQFNTAVSDADLASLAGTETLTNKTISAGTLSGTTTVSGLLDSSSYFLSTRTLAANTALESKVSGDTGTRFRIGADGKHDWGDATVGGTWDTNLYRSAANVLATDDSFSVGGSITVTGTVDGRDVSTDGSTLDSHVASTTAHGATGAVVGTTNTQTLTNKTLSLTSNTLTGTTAEFNTALSDGDFATLAGTETLTNKTISNGTLSGATTVSGGGTVDGRYIAADGAKLDGIEPFATADQTTEEIQDAAWGGTTLTGTQTGITVTYQDATNDVDFVTDVTLTNSATLTNKTISVDSNTISGIAASSFVLSNGSGNIDGAAAQKAIPSGVVVGTTDSQTLTNKTLTAPTVSDPTISGAATFSGTIEATGTSHFNIPAGTTAQRPGTPTVGDIRYNSTTGTFEGYKSGSWGTLGGGGAGYGTLNIIRTNPTTIDENITFSTNTNGVTVGPITVSTSYTLDVSASGARLVVL